MLSGATSTRPRASRSCTSCARRKVKCNQTRPVCGRCDEGGLQCLYAPFCNQTRKTPVTFIDETSTIIADYESLSQQPDRHDDIHEGTGGDEMASVQCSRADSERIGIGNRCGHLFTGPQSRSRYVSPDFFAMISQDMNEVNSLLQQQQLYTTDPEVYLLLDKPQLQRQGPAYGNPAIAAESPPPHSKSIIGQLCGDIFLAPPIWSTERSMARSTGRFDGYEAILNALPSHAQCEALIWSYLKGHHTVSPVFHGPTFLRLVRRFFERDDITSQHVDLHFFALLTAVIFAGCAICPRQGLREIFGGQSREELSSLFYQHAVRAIRLTNFPHTPSVSTLSAFLIVDTIWFREEQPLACSSFVGLAIRVAQVLGLHEDPGNFPDISDIDMQVRRQLWWFLVAIDVQVALAAGLPPIISCTSCDVQLPSDMSEVVLEGNNSRQDRSRSILGVLVGGKLKFYEAVNKILHAIHTSKSTRTHLDNIFKIVHTTIASLVSHQQLISDVEVTMGVPFAVLNGNDEMTTLRETQSNSVFARFAKALLSLYQHQFYAIIQGTVRRHRCDSDLLEKDLDVISGCRRHLHDFLEITQENDFQLWHWYCPGQLQPLHSLMTLILHMAQAPNDITTRETRKLIDFAIFMCGPYENQGILSNENGSFNSRLLSVAGSKVWDFIRQTRATVWTKTGLDPMVLNCPGRVEDIHIDGLLRNAEASPPLSQAGGSTELLGPLTSNGPGWCAVEWDPDFDGDVSMFFASQL